MVLYQYEMRVLNKKKQGLKPLRKTKHPNKAAPPRLKAKLAVVPQQATPPTMAIAAANRPCKT